MYFNTKMLPDGESSHKVTVSTIPENWLKNRFKNISVCKSPKILVLDSYLKILLFQMMTISLFFNHLLPMRKSMKMSTSMLLTSM